MATVNQKKSSSIYAVVSLLFTAQKIARVKTKAAINSDVLMTVNQTSKKCKFNLTIIPGMV